LPAEQPELRDAAGVVHTGHDGLSELRAVPGGFAGLSSLHRRVDMQMAASGYERRQSRRVPRVMASAALTVPIEQWSGR
jgi:hypothetical protein